MRGAPPVLWTAAGFAAGTAAGAALGFGWFLICSLPILIWRGPKSRAIPLLACFAAGLLWGTAAGRGARVCTAGIADGDRARVGGYFTRASAEGASTLRTGCGEVRVYTRDEAPPEARAVTVEGRWIRSVRPDGAETVYLSASSVAEEGDGERTRVPWPVRFRTAIRGRAAEALERRLGAQAGTASALVLAEREGIPRELWDAFARSGTAHLLSISGFHVGVIATLLGALLSAAGQPPRRRAAFVAAGVWAYVLLIGAPTSATRAAWMTTAFVLGRLRRAPSSALGALGLSALMIALLRPGVVGGAGFQLTVAGTAGILVLSRWIFAHWPAHRGRAAIAPAVAAGLGASVFTAPVLAHHFGQVPLLSLPSSILLTPLVAAAVPGVILTIVLDMLHIPGAGLAGAGAEGLLHVVTVAAAWIGALPGTVVPVTPLEAGLLAAGALLPMVLTAAPWRRRPAVRTAVAVLTALTVLWGGQAVLSLAGRGTLQVVAIDVGQGDAIALRTPRGRWLLVDAGPRGFGGSDAGLTRVIPYLHARGARRLEAVVLTHPDEDHAGGLAAVLKGIATGAVLGPGVSLGQAGQMDGLAEARRAGVPWRRAFAGDSWTIDGVHFRVLHPPPPTAPGEEPAPATPGPDAPNDWSVVLEITWGDFSALLMGDADVFIESVVVAGRPADAPSVTLLKVGHHGSITSTAQGFVDAVRPEYAVISVGARNRYGHPDPQVLARLEGAGTHIFRTDLHGTVTVIARRDGSVTVRRARR